MSEKGKEIVLSKTVHRDLKNNEFVTENDWLNPSFVFPKDGFDLEKEILRLIDQAISQTNEIFRKRQGYLACQNIRYRLQKKK